MNAKESKRYLVLEKLAERRIKQVDAAKFLECSTRHVRELLKKYRLYGIKGLLSKKRGMVSNRKYPDNFKQTVIKLILEQYQDFGPTLASEVLLERDNLKISKETARQWMIEAGIWSAKKEKHRIHQPRDKRPYYGALIQIDGSPHDWFEGRSEPCTLIVFVDDATSRIQLIRFFPAETTFAYFNVMQLYIQRYGLPCALYSDKHSIFRVNHPEPESGTGLTQFGRAMDALGVELIYAHSPQAKGRVERKNRSLQDRLIKMMRLDGINSMEMANEFYLDKFTEQYNKKFSTEAAFDDNVHQPIEDFESLALHFTIQSKRKISKNLTISYHGKIYKIKQPDKARRLYQAEVTICEGESGEIAMLYKGQPLPYELYLSRQKKHNATKTRKELDSCLFKLPKLDKNKGHIPAVNHPWKRRYCAK